MTLEEGLKQIDSTPWVRDIDDNCLNLFVKDKDSHIVHAWLLLRPHYCDRGHLQLMINGIPSLDAQDSFPRYFFSFEEADLHTRTFLKWRLWKKRVQSSIEIDKMFKGV